MKISIVTTMYCSSPYLHEFYERMKKTVEAITQDYEMIFVDDGSPDDSLKVAQSFLEENKRVSIIELSRNFGHHKAILTGLKYTKGDFVFLIDCDLEEQPELLLEFWSQMSSTPDIDMIYGVQKSRKGGLFERFSGGLFYTLFNLFSDVKIPRNFLTIRLMKQCFVEALTQFGYQNMVFSIAVEQTGFKKRALLVEKGFRKSTNYTFLKKLHLLINTLVSSTERPLWVVFYFGLICAIFSLGLIGKLVVDKVFLGGVLEGWTSIMASIWFFGGTLVMLLGVLGIYISKVLFEVQTKPVSIVRQYLSPDNSMVKNNEH